MLEREAVSRKNVGEFKPFSDEHQTYKETQSFSSGGMFTLISYLERKVENYVNNLALLADATARDCKKNTLKLRPLSPPSRPNSYWRKNIS